MNCEPQKIWDEYQKGINYKSGITRRGLYEQTKINQRMYAGDQWHGAQCGGDKPLIRYNIIKRIGEYKMAMVAGSNVAVNFSAEGVPNTVGIKDEAKRGREKIKEINSSVYPLPIDTDTSVMIDDESGAPVEMSKPAQIQLAMEALSDYHKVTAERVKLDDLKTKLLLNAYISGTGILYTYWDDTITTGLYADEQMQSPIKGDIACEVLDIENVYFGNPSVDDLQGQPYIIVAQRRELEDVRREARRNRLPDDDITVNDTQTDYREMTDSKHTTVLTKFYKEWDDNGNCRIMAVKVTEKAIVRRPWDTRLRLYPFAKINWEQIKNCIYGDSEVTHIVPNQIAINRAITAAVWAVMKIGMPTMLVNGDIVNSPVTNDPGEIIRVYGEANETAGAIQYVTPPNFSPQFDNIVNSLITNTQVQAGANDAALGDMKPENTSAIIAVREAATLPMQLLKNRFYSCLEDNARVWADYWINYYQHRAIKMEDDDGEWYFPINTEDYKNLIISARVDVGQASLWSQIQEQSTLDNLLTAGIITPLQYLERLPKGTVQNITELINHYKDMEAAQTLPTVPTEPTIPTEQVPPEIPSQQEMYADQPQAPSLDGIDPELAAQFAGMTPEQQQRVIEILRG